MSGLPVSVNRSFRGNRVEANRAGITIWLRDVECIRLVLAGRSAVRSMLIGRTDSCRRAFGAMVDYEKGHWARAIRCRRKGNSGIQEIDSCAESSGTLGSGKRLIF